MLRPRPALQWRSHHDMDSNGGSGFQYGDEHHDGADNDGHHAADGGEGGGGGHHPDPPPDHHSSGEDGGGGGPKEYGAGLGSTKAVAAVASSAAGTAGTSLASARRAGSDYDLAGLLDRLELIAPADVQIVRFLGAGGCAGAAAAWALYIAGRLLALPSSQRCVPRLAASLTSHSTCYRPAAPRRYGDVNLGRWQGCEVAVKCLNPSLFFHGGDAAALNREAVADLIREADMLGSLRHPNIVWVYGVVLPGVPGSRAGRAAGHARHDGRDRGGGGGAGRAGRGAPPRRGERVHGWGLAEDGAGAARRRGWCWRWTPPRVSSRARGQGRAGGAEQAGAGGPRRPADAEWA